MTRRSADFLDDGVRFDYDIIGIEGLRCADSEAVAKIAGALRDNSDDLLRAVRWDTTDWEGEAGDAYRAWSTNQQNTITALAHAADTMAVYKSVL